MKTKKFGKPRAKNGELKVQWGVLPDNNPDICYIWGEGVKSCDSNLLYYMFGTKRQHLLHGDEIVENNGQLIKWEKSLLEELDARGYDLTTLKFSIQKKKQ